MYRSIYFWCLFNDAVFYWGCLLLKGRVIAAELWTDKGIEGSCLGLFEAPYWNFVEAPAAIHSISQYIVIVQRLVRLSGKQWTRCMQYTQYMQYMQYTQYTQYMLTLKRNSSWFRSRSQRASYPVALWIAEVAFKRIYRLCCIYLNFKQ